MDHDWLWDRGGLHDARIVSVTFQDGGLVLALTDEWANENDNRASASPGKLILEGVAADATITSLEGGWISEIQFSDGVLHLAFCDRDAIKLRPKAMNWRPDL